jgi:hypothetical protein
MTGAVLGAAAPSQRHLTARLVDDSQGQGSGDISTADCIQRIDSIDTGANLTLFGADLGAQYTFVQKQLGKPLGTSPEVSWEDDITDGLKVGFKLTEGDSITGSLLHKVGVGASISTSSHAELTETNMYTVSSKSQADALVRWGLDRYGLEELALPGVAQLVTPTLDSQPVVREVSPPTKTELGLTGALTMDVELGEGQSYSASIDVGGKAAIALENEKNTNRSGVDKPSKIEFALGLEGSGEQSASTVLATGRDTISTDGEVSLTFARTIGNLWVPSLAGLDITVGTATAIATKAGSSDGGGGLADSVGGSTDAEFSVDLTHHPDIAADFVRLVNAARNATGPHATPDDEVNYTQRARNFAQLLNGYGDATLEEFNVIKGSLDFNVAFGEGLSFGGSANGEGSDETLTGAWYRTGDGRVAPSTGCRAGPASATASS